MILAKLLLISALSFTQATRTPIGDHPCDYEFAGDMTAKLVKYVDMTVYGRFLLEREEGLYGTGHDIDLSYESYGYIFKKLKFKRNFTSYYRQVKKMSLQTIDTSYKLLKETKYKCPIKIGYSLAFENFSNIQLMAYGMIDLRYIDYKLWINPDSTISKITIHYEPNREKGLVPFIAFDHIRINNKIDWKQKIGIKINF